PTEVEQFRAREILARRDHLVRRFGVRKVLGLVDQNDPAGHRRGPFRITMAAASPSRPKRAICSKAGQGTARPAPAAGRLGGALVVAGSCIRTQRPSWPKANTQCGTLRRIM